MIEKEKSKPGDTLTAALHFNADDLKVNRNGVLSEFQKNWLGQSINIWHPEIVSLLFVLVLLLGLMFCATFVGVLSLFVPCGTFLFIILGLLWFQNRASKDGSLMQKDLKAGTVQSVEGIIRLDVDEISAQPHYKLNIDNLSFEIDHETFLAFKTNEPYCVYYLPHTLRLVSAEWLR